MKKTRKRSTKTNTKVVETRFSKNETTEEEQVDMKKQQNKLLAKIDNPSQEPPVVEGQTNIYDFGRIRRLIRLLLLFLTSLIA